MKCFSMVLALATIVSFVLFADIAIAENTEWWSYDSNEVPELLPKKLAGKSDDEIGKAVQQALQIQFDVITQHNGHSLDPEMPPIGYFNNEIPLTDVRTTNPETDLIFTNNNVRGFVGNENHVTIKWISNQVVTEIKWNELKIRGKYTFSNNTYFKQGKYLIELQGVKYLAATTLRENIQAYPSSVPKSSVTYSNAKVSFNTGLSEITKPSDSPNVNYLLDVIVRQQIADHVAKDAHKNATLAMWKVAKPFIVFKNYTDPFFPGVNGTLPDAAATKYVVDKFPVSGLEMIRHQVKNVAAHMAANTVKIDLQLTAHDLSGYYDYTLGGGEKKSSGSFTIVRMDVEVNFNVLNVNDGCKTVTTFVQPVNSFDDAGFGDTEVGKSLTTTFFDHIKNEINTSYCKCMAAWYKPQV